MSYSCSHLQISLFALKQNRKVVKTGLEFMVLTDVLLLFSNTKLHLVVLFLFLHSFSTYVPCFR